MSETLTSSPGQIDASQCKFEKSELAYGLAMGGQTDSQVDSKITQVAKSRKFHVYTDDLRSACVGLALDGQTVKNFRWLTNEFELDHSQPKSSQVHASGWPNETQVEGKSKTCVDLRRLVSPFGQDLVKD